MSLGVDDNTPLKETEKEATIADLLKARSGIYLPALGESVLVKGRWDHASRQETPMNGSCERVTGTRKWPFFIS